jgi:hypothetical protein
MGTLAVDNIQHTDGSSAVTLNNANITTGTIPAASVTGTFPSGLGLATLIPYTSSSAAGSQNIGGLRFQWGSGTLPSSGNDVGSNTYGVANRYYKVMRVDYTGFSEAPHLAHAMQGNGYHETKIANYEFQHGHSSGDYFNFIVTSSRTAGWVSTAYKWLLIGKAS